MIAYRRATAVLLPALVLAGCYNLDLTNPNEPDLVRALSTPDEVESHIAAAFHDWYRIQTGYNTLSKVLSAASFQHSSFAECDAPHAYIPRTAVPNGLGSAGCVYSRRTYQHLYGVLVRVADGLRVLDERPELGARFTPDEIERITAVARLVQGLAHGSVALLYDRGAVVDETVEPTDSWLLLDHDALAAVALEYLYEAVALSEDATWGSVPAEWMSTEVSSDELARLAHSWAAQLRANMARNPIQRAAVDWAAVRADVEVGITEDWVVDATGDWSADALLVIHRLIRPTQLPYFIAGMADQSGNFQRWLSQPPRDRRPIPLSADEGEADPILLVTPDTRFPQGATVAEQIENPGSMFLIPSVETTGTDVTGQWQVPGRGTWRWSFYRYGDGMRYAESVDTHWPLLTVAEMRLLEAEALLRSGDLTGAAALVNESRTAHGLLPTDGTSANPDCVPRLPDGECGGLLEMLKWEKRLETYWKGAFHSSWFFDGRAWGDLYAGTALQFAIPCDDLTKLHLECYTFGGGETEGTSPGSAYEWPFEVF